MYSTLARLIDRLASPAVAGTDIIMWGCPIPSFGNVLTSKVATLGINPSNKEFVDDSGTELDGNRRRFHTLKSLSIDSWEEADSTHIGLIMQSCQEYFLQNPYDRWFRRLDEIIYGADASFYDDESNACHLDLVPYATARKWTSLTSGQRDKLLDAIGDSVADLIRASPVRVLILNGRSVVSHFERIADCRLDVEDMPTWSLPRNRCSDVSGKAYKSVIDRIADVHLGRDMLVLGFNHNIQSSFGVTKRVIVEIRNWIADSIQEVNLEAER